MDELIKLNILSQSNLSKIYTRYLHKEGLSILRSFEELCELEGI